MQSWKDMDRHFFEVIESDKKIIFLVLLILMIVAGFNVSSSLFVQVFRKTKEISIFKSFGGKEEFDWKFVSNQWLNFWFYRLCFWVYFRVLFLLCAGYLSKHISFYPYSAPLIYWMKSSHINL